MKTMNHVPSTSDGVVKEISIASGDEVNIGQLLIKIESDDSTKDEPKAKSDPVEKKEDVVEQKTESSQKTSKPASIPMDTSSDKIFASPGVRRLARELEINLLQISGTGDKGRITKDDLKSYEKDKSFNQWVSKCTNPHKKKGYRSVIFSLKATGNPPGDATSSQMRAVATLSEEYSFGAVRVCRKDLVVRHQSAPRRR